MTTARPFSQELWDQTPAAVQDDSRALEARVTALEAIVQRLDATVQPVTERLQQDSRPSSRPPSREPSGRRPGGQPGHAGHPRAWVPIARGAVVIPVKPERCARCPHPWHGEDGQPPRHQVTEIPPVKPIVTEYQRQRLGCPIWGETTGAQLPGGVPSGACGPRVQAVTAWCPGASHLSTRTTPRVMDDLCGLSIRLGTRASLAQSTAQAVAEPVAAARRSVHQPPAAYLDATGWRAGRQRAWLWTTVTASVTVCVVRRSRRGQVARALLGERCWGWLVTERWRAYHWDPTWRRQRYWAHLWRDIEAMWTFVRQEGVEPTNHVAERAIRPGVRWRQGRVGTHSPEGSRFVEAMMTVGATLTQQHRHVLDYLTAACEATLCGQTAPALRPMPAALEQRLRSAA